MWSGKRQCTAAGSYEHDNAPSCSIKDFFFFWTAELPHIMSYTGCFRRNLPYFGRTFVMLIPIDTTKHIHIRSWTVTEMQKKMWSFCVPKYSTCLTWCVIRTLHRSGLEPAAKPSHTEACVLCTTLETVRTILIQLVGVLLLNYSCYIIYVTQILITC
jgi:hypothetical protein